MCLVEKYLVFVILVCADIVSCKSVFEPTPTYKKLRVLSDVEEELRVLEHGIFAKRTLLSNNMSSFEFRELSNGESVLRLVYTGDGVLTDCDHSFERRDVEKFMSDFYAGSKDVDYNGELEPGLTDFHTMKKHCRRLHLVLKKAVQTKHKKPQAVLRRKRDLTFPGTKWCGVGNNAKTFSDLGEEAYTDRCCRQHDHCPRTITGFSSNYGYFNYRFHTLNHCDCDASLRKCFQKSKSSTSNFVGKLYFNYVQGQCFVLKPESTCSERSWWGTCQKYEFQLTAKLRDLDPWE